MTPDEERLELAMRLRNLALSGDTESIKKLLEFIATLNIEGPEEPEEHADI